MKTDLKLKMDIEEELLWDPKVNAAQIGVTVDHGAVALLGAVDTYAERSAAEEATKRVSGVRTVAQDLTVKILTDHKRSDPELAMAIDSALKWNVYVPKSVTATVQHGMVTLAGEVRWHYQRDAAENAVRHLTGIAGVSNLVSLTPHALVEQVKEKVQAALQRQAAVDTSTIHIEATGGKVTLTGHASSWQIINDATVAAWAAPGVTQVVDHVKMVSM